MLMKAGTDTLRRQNRALVLSTLRKLGPESHTGISEWTGLSSATVTAITHELEEDQILERVEQAPTSGRGRPRVLFRQIPDSGFIAIIRMVSDMIEYSLVDYTGKLKDRFSFNRDILGQSVEQFRQRFCEGLDQLTARNQLVADQILTISITSKGLVSRGAPVLLWSPIFDDEKIDFEQMLRGKWKARVTLTNETRYAAQAAAEKIRTANLNSRSRTHATLSLDHSIGLGIASEESSGKITSFAPPFGHMVHMVDGHLCRCGMRGCIEAYAGFYGILRNAFKVTPDTIPAKFIPFGEMEKIAERARNGDRMAQYAFRQAGDAIGIGISRLHSFLGTMPVTITGPGMAFLDLMREAMETQIKNNLQVRFDEMPSLQVDEDEAGLVYQGNVQASLADLDTGIMADRRVYGRTQIDEAGIV
jgi:predicted NBD/HSP70 family sugar kinase